MKRFLAFRMLGPFALMALFAALSPASVLAQSATAGEGLMGAGQQAPFVTQSFPPSLTAEQLRQRDEAMSRANRAGPRLPIGPERVAPKVPETTGPFAPSAPRAGGSFEPQASSPAASDFTFFRTTGQNP